MTEGQIQETTALTTAAQDETDRRDTADDLLWQQLKTIPAFRALLRAVEARFYHAIDLPDPVLDLGCGDGHFAAMAFDRRLTAGIDPWWGPLQKARRKGIYDLALQADGDLLPYPNDYFNSAFSNSVLEHIPDVQPVLNEMSRVLRPGAPLVLTMPSHLFTEYLGGAGFFERLGMGSMAGRYRHFFNRISRHAHTDPPEVWGERLAEAGFVVERWQYYFSREALRALEVGHVQGVPSAVLHGLTGHWIIGPWRSNLRHTERWLRPYYEEPFPDEGAYIFMVARQMADHPLSLSLPPPQPFSLPELQRMEAVALLPVSALQTPTEAITGSEADQPEDGVHLPPATETAGEATEKPFRWRSAALIVLGIAALLFAVSGQSSLRVTPDAPAEGLRWLLYSGLAIGLLIWLRRDNGESAPRSLRLPNLRRIQRKRWLLLPALLLALAARSFSNPAGEIRPWLSLLTWFLAIASALYALYDPPADDQERSWLPSFDAFTWMASLVLFAAALALRFYQLAEHPFILNGTEASLGLDALGIAQGNARAPFGTSWLTNPTLSLYALALPLRLLGPSVFALRFLSAIAGALTVVATYLFGQRLYGRMAGLAAAIMLLGSHYHLHFSRLGLTNVWDGLLVLLTLGLWAVAWDDTPQRRSNLYWLGAGVAAGFSAYLFSSSHLLPAILAILLLLMFVFQRQKLRANGRQLLAAAMIALIIALPQIMFYRATPGLFMERFRALGILEGQTGWLVDEMARSGLSQWQIWQQQLGRSALAFNAVADSGTSYGALVPLLNFFAGLFFLLGSIVAALRFNRLRFGMLIVWVVVTVLLAGAILLEPPNSHRLIIAAPAVHLLAGIGLAFAINALGGRSAGAVDSATAEEKRRLSWPVALMTAAVVIAGVVALLDVNYYFGAYRNQHHFGDRNTEIADVMSDYLNSLDGEWDAYFYGPPSMYVGFPTIPFLVRDFEANRNLFDIINPGDPLPQSAAPNQVHIFLPERFGELDQVRAALAAGQERSFAGYYADPLFAALEVRN